MAKEKPNFTREQGVEFFFFDLLNDEGRNKFNSPVLYIGLVIFAFVEPIFDKKIQKGLLYILLFKQFVDNAEGVDS